MTSCINSFLRPNNEGVYPTAREFKTKIIPTVHRTLFNAVNTSPYPVYFFRVNRHGVKCTCTGEDQRATLDEDGKLPSDVISKILSGSHKDTTPLIVEENQRPAIIDIFDENPIVVTEGVEDDADVIEDIKTAPVSDTVTEVDEGNFELIGQLDMMEMVSCPICLGSGFVNSLHPINGNRTVLHVDSPLTLTNAHVHETVYPNEFGVEADGKVEFKVTLPKSFNKVAVSLGVWNGDERTNFKITDKATGNIVSRRNMLSLYDGKEHTLVITSVGTGHRIFTHVELQTTNGKVLMANIGNVPDVEDLSGFSANISVQATLEVPYKVNKGDMFTDGVHQRTWIVQSVESVEDSDRNVFNVTMNVRLAIESEVYNVLPKPPKMLRNC